MNLIEGILPPPPECVQWCRAQPYQLQVMDDGAPVDLKWWNARLRFQHLDFCLRGRDLDARVVADGKATVLRSDLSLDSPLIDGDDKVLGLLYLCAAWQSGHPSRWSIRRFPRVEAVGLRRGEYPLDRIRGVLDHCITHKSLIHSAIRRQSDFPETPDVGLGLLATFMWAVGVEFEGRRAQLIDQNGLSTLVHCGSLELPVLGNYTRNRYNRYLELLDAWSQAIGTPPEMVECWLVSRWHARKQEARAGGFYQPRLF